MRLEKITELAKTPRTYADACGAAHALDLLGERWALLVVRELIFGPKRFGELRGDLSGISANVLTQRLEGLEAAGIVVRRRLPPPASAQVYELTPWGYESEPIFQALGRWATRSPHHDPTLPISAVSVLLSFRTMFDAKRAGGLAALIGLRFGEQDFLAHIADGAISIRRGDLDAADVVFAGPPQALAAAIYGGVPLDAFVGDGALVVQGNRKLADRFVTLFPLPEKVTAPG